METLLNLLWLIVALGLIGLWRFRWRGSRTNTATGVLPEVVAIGCAISLLLPVISLTDDLHPEIVAVDAASGKRHSGLLIAGATKTRHAVPLSNSHSATAVLDSRFADVELNCVGSVLLIDSVSPTVPCASRPGRSPPSLL
jgi:hypothetical protein